MSGAGVPIPLSIDGARAVEMLEKFAQSMDKAGSTTEDSGKKAKSASSAWSDLKSAVEGAGVAFNQLVALADSIAALATEQQRLDETSARLGLNFNEAADGAGRFVDETDAMAAASQLAEAGLRLSQYELNTLTQRAAITSQRLGVDMPTAFGMLTTAIESGSSRALRPFGADLVALGGSSHTARERLDALMESTHRLSPATDDAATSMERLRDSFGDAARTAASTASTEFFAMFHAQEQLSAKTRDTGTATIDLESKLRSTAHYAAEAALLIVRAVQVIANGIAAAMVAPAAAIAVVGRALNEIRQGNFAAAQEIFGNFGSNVFGTFGLQGFSDRAASSVENLTDTVEGLRSGRVQSVAAESIAREQAAREAAGREAARHAGGGTSGGGGGSGAAAAARQERAESDMTIAIQQKVNAREGNVHDWQVELNRPAYEAQMAERREELARVNREGARETAIEQTARNKRPGADESIGSQLRTQLREYGDTAKQVRDSVVGAFTDMTDALGTHITAWMKGKETLKEALQGMLRDTLESISKRAAVSGAEQTAAALASLAMGDFAGAGLHAASAAAFFGVAGLAGLGAQALAETPAAKGGSAGAAAHSAASVTPRDGGKEAAPAPITINFTGAMYGTGGIRQASRELAGVLNAGAVLGGVSLVPQLVPSVR